VVGDEGQPAGERQRVVGDAQLAQDRRRVEIDALADDPFALELEDRHRPAREGAARRRQAAVAAAVGALEVELDDDGVVGVVHGDQRVALVGERAARLLEVARDSIRAVVDVAGRHDLVARMAERGERGREVVAVLRLHVLAHDGFAPGAQIADGRHRPRP